MSTTIITIDMGKKCVECHKGGAQPNELCLRCTTKAMDVRKIMKTPQGRAVQIRWQDILKKSRS